MKRNSDCLMTILNKHGSELTTSQILKFTVLYPELCKDCSSGSVVISTAKELMEKGIVKRTIAKGGFRWSLNPE
jgi:hypothetical protein